MEEEVVTSREENIEKDEMADNETSEEEESQNLHQFRSGTDCPDKTERDGAYAR